MMWGLFGFRPPCDETDRARDERLSRLLDAPDADTKLGAHVAGCARCQRALTALRADRARLAGLGDPPGAAPDDAEFRRVLAAVSLDRATRRPRIWMAWVAASAAVVVMAALGARQWVLVRDGTVSDTAILAGADAAFRRAEHEYMDAVTLLRTQLDRQPGVADPRRVAGARAIEQARAHAAALAAARRGDPEREALLREALRSEVRYYEDALMRAGVTPEPQP